MTIVFEIFSEEIPATLQEGIALNYEKFVKEELIIKNDNKCQLLIGITLNRLVMIINNYDIDKDELKSFINKTLKDFSKTFPRTMCYPQSDVRWIRPIRNIFACIDNSVIDGEFCGIKADKCTFVEKFIVCRCNSCEEYLNCLKKNKIEINYNKRLDFVIKEIKFCKINEERYLYLAKEIAGMDECCTEPIKCVLDKKFRILPFELIKLVLQKNQRYVVYKNKTDIEYLIFCSKITEDKKKRDLIKKGHEKVVDARLKDAMYYWALDADERKSFKDEKKYKDKLKSILSSRIFVNNVSWKDYLSYQSDLAHKFIKDKEILEKIENLIYDTKLDLVTNVVNEFPELQGIIGNIYFKYGFNPYMIGLFSPKENDIIKIYYHIIDRLAYISKMYELGNQPTGRGDKFKVKKRMDDFISAVENKNLDEKTKNGIIFFIKDKDYYELFLKRRKEINVK